MSGNNLESWIVGQRQTAPGAEWAELRHVGVSERRSPVQRWALVDEPSKIVSEIWVMAQQWADAAGSGPQRFCIAILDSSDRELAQFMTRVGSDSVGGTAWDSEPPTLEGVTRQLMRHNEANAKLTAASVQGVIDRLLTENERLSTRCEQLEARHIEMLTLHEQLLSQRVERELDIKRAERQDQRKDALIGKLGLLLPAAAAKLTGQTMVQDPSIKALAQSLESDQVSRIAAALKPEQLVVLLQMLQQHGDILDDTKQPPEVAE